MAPEGEERPEVRVGCRDNLAGLGGPTQDRRVVSGPHPDVDDVQRIVAGRLEALRDLW